MAVGERIRGAGYDVIDMGLRSIEFGLKAAIGAVGLVRAGAEAVLGSPQPGFPAARHGEPVPAEPSPRGRRRRRPRPAPSPEPPESAPVDEGITRVAEFAEPGAEDGAGPEIEIQEPWEGYAGMRAAEIGRALVDASPATLGAIRLYETAHKGRRSVIEAVDRRLARAH